MSEAFNSVLVDARSKPIITMLEEIKLYIMKMWATNRAKVKKYEDEICPKIHTRLSKESEKIKYWLPSWSGDKLFEVRHVSLIGGQVHREYRHSRLQLLKMAYQWDPMLPCNCYHELPQFKGRRLYS